MKTTTDRLRLVAIISERDVGHFFTREVKWLRRVPKLVWLDKCISSPLKPSDVGKMVFRDRDDLVWIESDEVFARRLSREAKALDFKD